MTFISGLPSNKTPFLLCFSKAIAPELFRSAVEDGARVNESYDPVTQTSVRGIFAGTSLTYDSTTTDWSVFTDDTRQVDT